MIQLSATYFVKTQTKSCIWILLGHIWIYFISLLTLNLALVYIGKHILDNHLLSVVFMAHFTINISHIL